MEAAPLEASQQSMTLPGRHRFRRGQLCPRATNPQRHHCAANSSCLRRPDCKENVRRDRRPGPTARPATPAWSPMATCRPSCSPGGEVSHRRRKSVGGVPRHDIEPSLEMRPTGKPPGVSAAGIPIRHSNTSQSRSGGSAPFRMWHPLSLRSGLPAPCYEAGGLFPSVSPCSVVSPAGWPARRGVATGRT